MSCFSLNIRFYIDYLPNRPYLEPPLRTYSLFSRLVLLWLLSTAGMTMTTKNYAIQPHFKKEQLICFFSINKNVAHLITLCVPQAFHQNCIIVVLQGILNFQFDESESHATMFRQFAYNSRADVQTLAPVPQTLSTDSQLVWNASKCPYQSDAFIHECSQALQFSETASVVSC